MPSLGAAGGSPQLERDWGVPSNLRSQAKDQGQGMGVTPLEAAAQAQ